MMRTYTMVLAALLLAGCQQGPSPEQLAKEKAEKMKHYSEVMQWRTERIERLTQPDGWLSLVGMHWLPKPVPMRLAVPSPLSSNSTRP